MSIPINRSNRLTMCFLTNSFRKAAFTSAAITGLTLCTEYSSCHPSSSSGGAITRAALPDAPDAASGGRSSHIQTQNGGGDPGHGGGPAGRIEHDFPSRSGNLNSSSLSSFVIKLPGPLNTVLRGNGSASSLVRPVTADGDCGHGGPAVTGTVTVTAVRRRAWTMMVTVRARPQDFKLLRAWTMTPKTQWPQ